MRSLRTAWLPLLVLLAAPAAPAAAASMPSCVYGSYPAFIDLVGCSAQGDSVDAQGTFTVTVRDLGYFGVPGANVWVQFKSDVAITSPDNCLLGITGADGAATFRVAGAGRNFTGASGFTGLGAARIFVSTYGSFCASITPCATVNVCTYDENGAAGGPRGVEITDLAAWAADYAQRSTAYRPRSDFNHGGTIDIIDMAWWGRVYLRHSSVSGCDGALYVNPTW